ncbi:MAG: prepilin-type N-terminal cleavage/methylation domain-containing protein [Alphaproteobacteria bacterium]|nr:prepilin-type N-terminal cleavage/methylation domain-containing protein [Alphaproteobacteria bacterium]
MHDAIDRKRFSSPRLQIRGFTLVELAIVLTVIGLLVGAVMVGRGIIRASELRSVMTETSSYVAAVNTFRLKYHSLPGDMINATDFWGAADANPATCLTIDKTGMTQTCNGNGDGKLNIGPGRAEIFYLWQHLANAGVIGGNYSGRVGPHGPHNPAYGLFVVPGYNVPGSKLKVGAAYSFRERGLNNSENDWFYGEYGTILMLGMAMNSNNLPRGPLLAPEEMYKIDLKIDDGLPGQGSLVTRTNRNPDTPFCTESAPGLADDTIGTNLDAVYRLSDKELRCVLIYRNFFE